MQRLQNRLDVSARGRKPYGAGHSLALRGGLKEKPGLNHQ